MIEFETSLLGQKNVYGPVKMFIHAKLGQA